MNLRKEQIQIIESYLSQKPVLKAFLFGSYATGYAHVESDIDILVELDYTERIGLEFIQMQLELQDLLKSKVDLVSTKGLSKYVKPFIDREKKLIYER